MAAPLEAKKSRISWDISILCTPKRELEHFDAFWDGFLTRIHVHVFFARGAMKVLIRSFPEGIPTTSLNSSLHAVLARLPSHALAPPRHVATSWSGHLGQDLSF